jgi:hypothetical protein
MEITAKALTGFLRLLKITTIDARVRKDDIVVITSLSDMPGMSG